MEPSHEVMTVRGITSPLLTAGPPSDATAVVCVHGNPGSSADWAGVVAAAGQHLRTVAFDMPGFGRADKPRDFDHTVPGYAEHLGAALDELGIERTHLVLHDFGGPWGLAWAAEHPERVASLVLVDTGTLLGYRGHRLALVWQTPLLGEAVMAVTPSPRLFRVLLERAYPFRGTGPALPGWFVEEMAHNFDADTRHAVLRLYRASRKLGRTVPVGLHRLTAPVLVIWGGRDPYIGVAQTQREREVFRHAEVVVLPGSGHWPMIDDAPSVESLVVDFLTR